MSHVSPVQGAARTAADDAARWFLRLQEESANSETFLEWQQWLNASPEYRRAYEEIEVTVLRLSRMSVKPALPSAEEMERDPYNGSEPILRWKENALSARMLTAGDGKSGWSRYAIAAGLAVILSGVGWFWIQHSRVGQVGEFSYKTSPGQRLVVQLPEGSRVTLDADSSLEVQLTTDRRALTLGRGEAFFQVSQDLQRPFVVRARAAQLTALGTAFNVRLSANRTVLAVIEGKVEFAAVPKTATASSAKSSPSAWRPAFSTRPKLTAQVSAGEGVSYVDDGELHVLPEHEAALAVAWLDGRRQYRNEPLKYVLADVDRYTGQTIELADQSAGDLRFTGTLNFKNSSAWLDGLSVALPVVVTQNEDGVMLVKKK